MGLKFMTKITLFVNLDKRKPSDTPSSSVYNLRDGTGLRVMRSSTIGFFPRKEEPNLVTPIPSHLKVTRQHELSNVCRFIYG